MHGIGKEKGAKVVNDKDLITIQSLNEFVKLMQDYFPENIKK